jgi:hypothetical protein
MLVRKLTACELPPGLFGVEVFMVLLWQRTTLLSDAPPMVTDLEQERNRRVHWSSLVRRRHPGRSISHSNECEALQRYQRTRASHTLAME